MFSGILRRIFGLLPELVFAFLLMGWALPLTWNPSLHIDEGYYLGATRAILDGDLLLRTYSFDKPFMIALWPIPGVLLLGKQALGFKLMSWLAYGVSFVLFARVLRERLEGRLLSLLVAGLLFSIPTFFVHGVSNFCEPYLILCAVLLMYGISSGASDSFLSRVFFLGLFTKYSFVLYLPLLIPRIRKSGIRAFLRPSIVILGLWFLYMIANPIKFGSLMWFSHFVLDRHADPYWIRTWNRAVQVFGSLDSALLSLLLMTGSVAWWVRARPSLTSEAMLLPGVVVSHLLIYLFMGANFYPRYVVQSLPAVFLLASRGLALVRGVGVRANLVEPALVLALFLILGSIVKMDRNPVDEDRALGRELQIYGSEANHEGAWVQNAYLWQSAPFSGSAWNEGCLEVECSERIRQAHPVFEKGYVFQDRKLRRTPLSTGKKHRIVQDEVMIPGALDLWAGRLLESLRLKRVYTVASLELEPQLAPEPGAIFLPRGVRIRARPAPGKPGFLPELELRFTIGVHEFHRGSGFPRPVVRLLARVEEFQIGGHDALDAVMPLFFEGYVLPLQELPLEYDPTVRYVPLELRPDGVRIQRETVRPSSG